MPTSGTDATTALDFSIAVAGDLASHPDPSGLAARVVEDVSRAAKVPAMCVRAVGLRAGSIIVDLQLLPSAAAFTGGRSLPQVVEELQEQARDPQSLLLKGAETKHLLFFSPFTHRPTSAKAARSHVAHPPYQHSSARQREMGAAVSRLEQERRAEAEKKARDGSLEAGAQSTGAKTGASDGDPVRELTELSPSGHMVDETARREQAERQVCVCVGRR